MNRWIVSKLFVNAGLCALTTSLLYAQLNSSLQPVTFASYGDNTVASDGVGSVDDFNQYLNCFGSNTRVHRFHQWAQTIHGTFVPMTDTPPAVAMGKKYPFALCGCAANTTARLTSGTLRIDMLIEPPSLTSSTNERVFFWHEDNVLNSAAGIAFNLGARLRYTIRQTFPGDLHHPLWVSVVIDMASGRAYGYKLDSFGRTERCYGLLRFGSNTGVVSAWGSVPGDSGSPRDVLRLASDGNLFGMVTDLTLSYVEWRAHMLSPLSASPND